MPSLSNMDPFEGLSLLGSYVPSLPLSQVRSWLVVGTGTSVLIGALTSGDIGAGGQ